jgi:hypothetical protein
MSEAAKTFEIYNYLNTEMASHKHGHHQAYSPEGRNIIQLFTCAIPIAGLSVRSSR